MAPLKKDTDNLSKALQNTLNEEEHTRRVVDLFILALFLIFLMYVAA